MINEYHVDADGNVDGDGDGDGDDRLRRSET